MRYAVDRARLEHKVSATGPLCTLRRVCDTSADLCRTLRTPDRCNSRSTAGGAKQLEFNQGLERRRSGRSLAGTAGVLLQAGAPGPMEAGVRYGLHAWQ